MNHDENNKLEIYFKHLFKLIDSFKLDKCVSPRHEHKHEPEKAAQRQKLLLNYF